MMKILVCLVVFAAFIGCSSEGTGTVIVPEFSFAQIDGAPHRVKFTNLTIYLGMAPSITSHIWKFGQDDVGSFERSPEFDYLRSGTYTVTLTECVEIFFCNTITKQVTVN